MSTDSPSSSAKSLDDVASRLKQRPVWLRIGQLIDGVSNQPLRDADIVFDAKQILFVGLNPPREYLHDGQTAPDATLSDHTLLPCLIEAHAHMFLEGAPIDFAVRQQQLKDPVDEMLARAQARWSKILQCGVGTVRDAGDKHGIGLSLAADARTRLGKLSITPFIDSPGAAIHHRGRYGSFMGQPIEDHASPGDCVASRVADRADRIKLLVSGIIDFKSGQVITPPQMPVEEVRVLVEAAHRLDRQTFAHASGTEGVENSIEGGVTTVEHGFFITEAQLARMRDKQIAWVPTFAPVQLQIDRATELGWDENVVANLKRIIESHQRMLRLAEEMGVTVLAGSDAGSCGVPHGVGLLQELCLMERAGMSTMTILRAATGVSAATLNFPEPIGRIAPNCRSRLILTRHDPLSTVANLQKAKTILFDGQLIHCSDDFALQGL